MKSAATTGQFASLLSRLVSGQLAEGDAAKIQDFLRGSKAARDYYRNYLAVHLDLVEHFRENAAVPFPLLVPRVRPLGVLALAALVPLAIGLGMWWAALRNPVPLDSSTPLVTVSEPGLVLAVTGYCADLRWSLAEPPLAGVSLPCKPVTLEQGTLVLYLVGGQTLTLKGPARFELLNDKEMRLHHGDVALRMVKGHNGYLIHVPGGAVADLGTEFSVKVSADDLVDVRVFEGKAVVSSTDAGNRTRYERSLTAGQSVRIDEALKDSPLAAGDFLRPHFEATKMPSPAGDGYAKVVRESAPLAWWRFEENSKNQVAAATSGTPPLVLGGSPQVMGPPGHRFLYTDTDYNTGHAAPESGIAGLDAPEGISLECLIHPESEHHMTAIVMEDLSMPVPDGQNFRAQHSQIERAGRTGESIGHIHPPYAIRGMIRTPSGYSGGVNTYTSESYLVRRWIHVVQTYDGVLLRLFVDGKLVNEAPHVNSLQGSVLHPVIAVLRPTRDENRRQWIGGIDEVALYNRVLSPEEIQTHYQALDR